MTMKKNQSDRGRDHRDADLRPPQRSNGADLRHRAEVRLPPTTRAGALSLPADHQTERLLHELEVHRVELELQNEELRAARNEAEEGLRRYTELFDFAPIGYLSLGSDHRILDVNFEASTFLRLAKGALVNCPLEAFVAAHCQAEVNALLRNVRPGEGDVTTEIELLPVRGAPTFVRFSARALDGPASKILIAFQDISESKAREERLARTECALREADRRKDDFLAALSHELRNPLAPIRNSVFVLSKANPGGEQARNAQEVIDRQVKHLTRLVDDLLDVTRITRGRVELRRERVELAGLVRRTIDDNRASFEESGVELAELQLDGKRPLDDDLRGDSAPLDDNQRGDNAPLDDNQRGDSAPLDKTQLGGKLPLDEKPENTAYWVQADPARLTQALSNLLSNAERFTPRGGRVQVSLGREKDGVAIHVRDNGAGIPSAVLPHLFEPFVQAPQTIERTRGGLGLGLAMVKGLVELHGGRVDIRSPGPGCGTEIVMLIPIDSAPKTSEDKNIMDEPAGHACHRRVLVIEDNTDAADSLRDALELSGHQVQVAYDGLEGVDMAHAFRPDVVICDIGLPKLDGYGVARALRADEDLRSTHLVALSGYALPEDLEHAAQAGFNQHIAKPPSLETLERLIAAVPPRQAALSPSPS